MELKDIKKAYFIGIKGAGMTAIAQILHSRGIVVSGSDTTEIFYTDDILKRQGIDFHEGYNASRIPQDADVIVYSTSYTKDNNPEMAAAITKKIPMFSYPQMLGKLFQEKLGVAVSGTHGKTTLTAMLSEALLEAGTDPSAIVGGQVIAWQGCSLSGKGDYFVAEADEYQNKLQYYQPWSVILTSVDWDHPDFFPDFNAYKEVFKEFVKKIPKTGFLVVWGDAADTLEVARAATSKVLSYGFGIDCDYRIEDHKLEEKEGRIMQSFAVYFKGNLVGNYQTPLVGKHNVLNATAVVALTHAMNLDQAKIGHALSVFKGTTRRFEYIGNYQQAALIDDYAHHPDEINATLAGARAHFSDKKIWTVFHPHTFSRTKALLQDFAQSFADTEKVIIIDTYASAREHSDENTSAELVKLINKYQYGKAEYIPTIEEAIEYLKERSGQYDVLITMGAGDVWRVAKNLSSLGGV